MALASEHAMEVGTADSEIRSGQRGTGEADQSAFGLVRGGSHFTCCVLFGGDVGFPLRCAFRMLATRKDLANAINEARYFYLLLMYVMVFKPIMEKITDMDGIERQIRSGQR